MRFVAPITITLVVESKPSISVRIWFSVCSRSSLPPKLAAGAAARTADRVELVDEDDRRRLLLRLAEQVAHARGADADDRLDELRGRHREERRARLAGDGPREQRLAGSGRPAQEDAARDPAAEPAVLLRVAQEVDDLGQLLLRLVDAGDVGERHGLAARLVAARAGAAQRACCPRAAHPAEDPEQEQQQDDRRTEAEEEALPQRDAAPVEVAFTTTPCCSRSCESWFVSANDGISVTKRAEAVDVPAGFVACLKSPWSSEAVEVTVTTLSARTCSRKNGLYGTRIRVCWITRCAPQ